MVEKQAEQQWDELEKLNKNAAGGGAGGSQIDLEYDRFCFSSIGWCGRKQFFPPQSVRITIIIRQFVAIS